MKLLLISLLAAYFAAAPCVAQVAVNAPVNTVLPDGVRIISQQESDTDLVAVDLFVRVGAAEETPSDTGIGTMVASCLLTGTANQDPATISRTLGNLGGDIRASWQPDLTQIKALVLSSQFDDCAYLLSDVLKNADFPDHSVESSRADMLARLQDNSSDLYQQTYDLMRGALYSGSAYSRSGLGTNETINRFTGPELRSFFHRYYRPENIVISVVGNISPQDVIQAFGADLSDYSRHRANPDPSIDVPQTTPRINPLEVKQYLPSISVGLAIAGYVAPGSDSKDYAAMQVANTLLGGMKTSLMFTNLRTKKMYGYEVASNYSPQIGVSDVIGYIVFSPSQENPQTKKPDSMTPVIRDALVDQFRIMRETGPSDILLNRAKKFLIGTYLLEHERLEDRAYYLGYSELAMKNNGGYLFDSHYADIINAVTAADVQKVTQKYFAGSPVVALSLPGDPNVGNQTD